MEGNTTDSFHLLLPGMGNSDYPLRTARGTQLQMQQPAPHAQEILPCIRGCLSLDSHLQHYRYFAILFKV
jgi:hypothetical protein